MKCAECDQIGQCHRSCETGAQLESMLDDMWEPHNPEWDVPPDTVRESDEEEPFLLTRKAVYHIDYQPQTMRGIGY